ncbi:CDP-diacylglycerol---serine O-phosphatidyltransferase [Andreprevotia lacus DSM 23236]|uniref:CDP-diacylglycerol--serine O-phosphatidyltransferase n=1 Tax=Andreprevotia lacus DSM 23236 TaxID=1121001 RepID=A0A1W1Y1H0_9NEIS|nr:CDP-diacylglycerol--serine O-phosphatidyltransferase [Andreprevotia lacus]SMC30003.1 CDP-diacylglycerol---serine O-phosphatidyltransferase [Andreprevotia lacus DSM 23236]
MHLPSKRAQTLRRQSIYLLPNLFTLGALFGGFYAIVSAMNGQFEHAAVAIFVSMILDSLDGRVARMTHTQSEFGAQFDSLSDMVSFGVAPALVAYEWQLHTFGKPGWMVAFIYCACAALRLARFNANISIVDKRWFQGLPSPAAAALVAGLVWISREFNDEFNPIAHLLPYAAFAITLFAGLTMVSNVRFWSFKEFNARKTVPFMAMVVAVLLLLVGVSRPELVFFLFFLGYAISGYVYWVWRALRPQQNGTPPPVNPT